MHGKRFLISVMSLQRPTGFREVNVMILTLCEFLYEKQVAVFAYVAIINAAPRHDNLVLKGCFSECPRFGA